MRLVIMTNYKDYNGTEYDYSKDEILDNGRLYNKKYGNFNPNIDLDDEDIEFEPEMFDPDCW